MMIFAKAIAVALLLLTLPVLLGSSLSGAQETDILQDWDMRSFEGNTNYQRVTLDGAPVLQAEAQNSASALYQERRIDLLRTPFLHWRWRTDSAAPNGADETRKSGDDYPARVYVVRSGGLAFWRTKALNYVWSRQHPVDSRWPNPFAGDNVQMWAVDTGPENQDEWRTHVRDVRADWLAAFGEDIDSLDGLALMTDTDNSGGTARSWYADIHFSAQR